MKHSVKIAGLLGLTCMSLQAVRDPRPADVTVYVRGDGAPQGSVDYGARATVTWMYARVGVRIAWRDGTAGSGSPSISRVSIQVRFAGDSPYNASPEALAFALPFGSGATVITVMYDRIRTVARRSDREQSILAHVLAHEIGHVLQCTNQHAQTGVMKAHWNGQDYDAMQKKPLEFTPDDVDLIVQGVTARKARTASQR